MKFEEAQEIVNNNELLTEGLKHFKYSDALLKLAKKIKPKNQEAGELKKIAITASKEFKTLENKYINSSKQEKEELKKQYKALKSKYSTLVKKINIKRAITGVGVSLGAIILTVAGILIGERASFEIKLKNFYNAIDPIEMKDELVDIDKNINEYGHPEGLWDNEKQDLRSRLTDDYREIFKPKDGDSVGVKANKYRNIIFNHRNKNEEYGFNKTWKDFRDMEGEVDKLKNESKPSVDKAEKAFEKLANTRVMKRRGLTTSAKERYSELSDNGKRNAEESIEYFNLRNKIKHNRGESKLTSRAKEAFDDSFRIDIFKDNLKFIDDVTSMDIDDYLNNWKSSKK